MDPAVNPSRASRVESRNRFRGSDLTVLSVINDLEGGRPLENGARAHLSPPKSAPMPPLHSILDIEAAVRVLPFAERQRLAQHFQPSALQRCRLDERDARIGAMAQMLAMQP